RGRVAGAVAQRLAVPRVLGVGETLEIREGAPEGRGRAVGGPVVADQDPGARVAPDFLEHALEGLLFVVQGHDDDRPHGYSGLSNTRHNARPAPGMPRR